MNKPAVAAAVAAVNLCVLLASSAGISQPTPAKGNRAAVADTVHVINRRCEMTPDLMLKSITRRAEDTVASFTFRNSGSQSVPIWTPPPGHREAFFVMDAKTGRKYPLLDVTGLAIKPAKTNVRPGQTISFKLTFEKIPSAARKVHVIEGEVEPAPDENGNIPSTWRFMSVVLK